jgi:tetratricopeptide (TPR) repeat protein
MSRYEDQAMPARASVGRLRFDLDSLVLYDGSEIVPLAPLPAQMLAELVHANGDVVSGAAMRQALWGDAPIEERNLNQQIYILRRALRRDPRVSIQNVPRRGYRLLVAPAPVLAQAGRRRSGLLLASVLLAALAVLWLVAREYRATTSIDRDLAIANYLATSEGPDHLDRAAKDYRDIIVRHPNSDAAYGGLALVDAKRALNFDGTRRWRLFESARTEAAAAVRRNPGESNALTALGIISSVRDHHAGIAKRLFDAAVAADPTAESPRAWRARFLLSIGDFDAAGRDFRTLSLDAPTSGYAVGSFGEWLLLNGDYARATAVLQQAVDLGNHPGFTRYWLARSYELRGLDSQALRVADTLLALYPNELSVLALRMRIESRLGDARSMIADSRRIQNAADSQLDPVAIAYADVAMGKPDKALCALRQYVSLGLVDIDGFARLRTDPDFGALRRNRGFNTVVTL